MLGRSRTTFTLAWRYILLGLVTIAVAVWWGSKLPLGQDLDYHNFADQRTILGVPNGFDTLSNLAFLWVGVWGLFLVLDRRSSQAAARFASPEERIPYIVFFVGVAAVSVGSSYYHLLPNNARLVWDRLPMTVGFVSFLVSVFMERVSVRGAYSALWPALVIGAATVFYWSWTETLGGGDLRPYFFVQFYPLAAVPTLMILFPARYTGSLNLVGVVVFYVLAKNLEAKDDQVFESLTVFSGHTLKHLSAAFAAYWIGRMVKHRRLANC